MKQSLTETIELLLLENARLIYERDEIKKRRAEVQESCERWRTRCYELESEIHKLKSEYAKRITDEK